MLEQIRQHALEETFLNFEVGGETDTPPQLLFQEWPRPVSPDDIEQLKAQGCTAGDWARVRLAPKADRAAIRNVRFAGLCLVGEIGGPPVVWEDTIKLEAGLSDATLRDCMVGDGVVIHRCAHLDRVDIQRGATLADCGFIAGGPTTAMALEMPIHFGAETGGRSLPIFPGVTSEELAWLAERLGEVQLMHDYAEVCAAVRARVARCTVLIGEGSHVMGARRILRSALGPHSCVYGAAAIEESIVLSSKQQPSRIGTDASLHDVCTGVGVKVSSGALVRKALLCEAATAVDRVVIEDAIIGENASMGCGECRSCFVGPFAGMHHQSLLIATMWPGGRGTIGYGANVGSNHSGKAADLEHKAGEGVFFGLASVVKFPSNTTEAPYSLIASGTQMLPQRLAFPFSLVAPPSSAAPGLSPALNELYPGWVLGRCLYGLLRNEAKFTSRNKAPGAGLETRVLRPEWAKGVSDALDRLRSAKPSDKVVANGQACYVERGLHGCGKNYVTESARDDGIAWYSEGLQLMAAFEVVRVLEANPSADMETLRNALGDDLLRRISAQPTDVADWGRWAAGRLRKAVESARSDIARDQHRGDRVLDDFSARRDPATDAFLGKLEDRARALAGD